MIDRDSMVARLCDFQVLRWPIRILLVLPVLVIAALTGFRIAAALRETATREALAPSSGRLVQTLALLWGDEDTITPLDQAYDLQTLLPQARLTILPGLGHIPQIEDPAAFNDALLKALGKL